MSNLFVITKRVSLLLFCLLIEMNVNILATNESQRSDLNDVMNSSEISDNLEINYFKDIGIDSTNDTIESQSNVISINPVMNGLNESRNEDNKALAESQTHLNTSNELKVNCTPVNTYSADNQSTTESIENSSLIIVNASKLSEYLEIKPNITQTIGAKCVVVVFYYNWCPFTAKYAKHFNALARVYPQFHVLAIDAYGLNSVNMRYGLVGVPTVLFFHNGKVVGKANDSEPTVDSFVAYINQLTGLSPVMSTNITESDLLGPLSSTAQYKFDYLLIFSWIFCLICFSYLFAKSNLFKTTIETVRNNWREAEAQHEHID